MIQIGAPPPSTLHQPLEHLMACHRRIEERLRILEAHPDQAETVLRFLESTGALHTADEEHSLFPRLHLRATPKELVLLEQLEAEHEAAGEIAERLHHANGEEAVALARQLCDLYRHHIADEDSLLIPLARKRLTQADLEEISAEMRSRRAP